MYVDPFWFGVLVGIMFTIGLIIVLGTRRKK